MVHAQESTNDRPDLSSERAPHIDKTETLRKINKYLVMSPRRGSTPRQTDWLTVSFNVTLTLILNRGSYLGLCVYSGISRAKLCLRSLTGFAPVGHEETYATKLALLTPSQFLSRYYLLFTLNYNGATKLLNLLKESYFNTIAILVISVTSNNLMENIHWLMKLIVAWEVYVFISSINLGLKILMHSNGLVRIMCFVSWCTYIWLPIKLLNISV
jgi:hypothetical protein